MINHKGKHSKDAVEAIRASEEDMLVESKKTVSFGSLFGKKTWVEPDKEEPKKKEPKATEQVKKTWVESIDIEDVPW